MYLANKSSSSSYCSIEPRCKQCMVAVRVTRVKREKTTRVKREFVRKVAKETPKRLDTRHKICTPTLTKPYKEKTHEQKTHQEYSKGSNPHPRHPKYQANTIHRNTGLFSLGTRAGAFCNICNYCPIGQLLSAVVDDIGLSSLI